MWQISGSERNPCAINLAFRYYPASYLGWYIPFKMSLKNVWPIFCFCPSCVITKVDTRSRFVIILAQETMLTINRSEATVISNISNNLPTFRKRTCCFYKERPSDWETTMWLYTSRVDMQRFRLTEIRIHRPGWSGHKVISTLSSWAEGEGYRVKHWPIVAILNIKAPGLRQQESAHNITNGSLCCRACMRRSVSMDWK